MSICFLPQLTTTAQFAYLPATHADARGSFTELLRMGGYGQVSVNVIKPHICKGEHWHHTKHEKFVVVAGQAVDLASEGLANVSLRTVEGIHRRKTGALIRCAVRIGAIAAGASEARLASLTVYGETLGLAFQIADDVLDATHASDKIGRAGGGDAARGKATYPGLLGVDGARKRARRAADDACAALRPFGARATALAALVRHVVERAA